MKKTNIGLQSLNVGAFSVIVKLLEGSLTALLQRGVRGGGAGGGGRGGGGHLPAAGLGQDLRPARCSQTRSHFRPLCL